MTNKTKTKAKPKPKRKVKVKTKTKVGKIHSKVFPKWTGGDVTDDNIEDFLKVFPEHYRKFCDYYLLTFNGLKSYQKIFPTCKRNTAKAQASRLLKVEKLQFYLDYRARKFADEMDITREKLMHDLVVIKQRCMQKVPVKEKIDGEWVETGEWVFDASNSLKATDMQGKELGMFRNIVQLDNMNASTHIVFHYIVPEIKPIDIATKNVEREISEQIEQYIIDRKKNKLK